jgi:hypothetical protein
MKDLTETDFSHLRRSLEYRRFALPNRNLRNLWIVFDEKLI